MEKEDISLEELWAVEQSILDQVADFCEAHNLKYSLVYGTLLGAVRHRGFIPWDDDLDIAMPRDDYDKLLALWPQEGPEGFLLDCCELDASNVNTFSKIRKDHTTFLQSEGERKSLHHKGIFIDVFPFDRVAKGKLSNKIQLLDCALSLLYNRGHTSGSGGVTEFAERILLRLVPKKRYVSVSQFWGKRGRRWNHHHDFKLFCTATIRACRRYYPPDLFSHMEMRQFQGKEYAVFQEPERFLVIAYGDYYKLPPEEERIWRHHPILIDFEKNYEEITRSEKS